jgi:hypothetical protein
MGLRHGIWRSGTCELVYCPPRPRPANSRTAASEVTVLSASDGQGASGEKHRDITVGVSHVRIRTLCDPPPSIHRVFIRGPSARFGWVHTYVRRRIGLASNSCCGRAHVRSDVTSAGDSRGGGGSNMSYAALVLEARPSTRFEHDSGAVRTGLPCRCIVR